MRAARTVERMCDAAQVRAVIAWYESQCTMAARFYPAEKEFRRKLGELLAGRQGVITETVSTSLDRLESNGWMRRCATALADRLGFEGDMPAAASSDWFGPLGRMCRAATAFGVLHGGTHGRRAVRPRRSDWADVMHVTSAGLVGRFVTNDRGAAEVFAATWDGGRRDSVLLGRTFLTLLERPSDLRKVPSVRCPVGCS